MFVFWYWVLSVVFAVALAIYIYSSRAHIRELREELAKTKS